VIERREGGSVSVGQNAKLVCQSGRKKKKKTGRKWVAANLLGKETDDVAVSGAPLHFIDD
jgi:hypothetical protein